MAFPDVLRLTTATPFFCPRLLAANHPATPHIPIPSIECHHIPSVVFRVYHARPHSTDFCQSPLSSFGIHRFRRCLFFGIRLSGHYCPISLLFHLSHPPQPAAPGDINNMDAMPSGNRMNRGVLLTLAQRGRPRIAGVHGPDAGISGRRICGPELMECDPVGFRGLVAI